MTAVRSAIHRGASAIEYGILLFLVAIGVVLALSLTGTHISCLFYVNSNAMSSAAGATKANNVCGNPPVWSSTELAQSPYTMATASDGVPYSASVVATSPVNRPITYSIASGTLPAGLTLNPNSGIISGTPSTNPSSPGMTQTFQVIATDSSNSTSTPLSVTIPVNGAAVFAYTGADQTFVLPVSTLTVKVWGAGGGSDTGASSHAGTGGFTTATLRGVVGSSVTVIVGGGGGLLDGPGAYGGGGAKTGGGSPGCYGGRGGGRSAVAQFGNDLITAGAGGGAGLVSQNGSYSSGGAGGGSTGGNGYPSGTSGAAAVDNGMGGTQTAGGAGGHSNMYGGNPGTQYQGGTAGLLDDCSNGSGGGGWYGGGSGSDYGSGGGGGGSGYVGGNNVSNGTMTASALGAPPAQTSDPNYISGVAAGGYGSVGGPGEVVFNWTP